MYDIMTEEESFLKCLCKSIIEFLICNFSWKWPCSNKSSQITEYQTLSASCLFTENKLWGLLGSAGRAPVTLNSLQSEKKLGIFLLSYPVHIKSLLLIIMLITHSFNSHFLMDQSELTPAMLLITSHLDDKVKPNIFHIFSPVFVLHFLTCHTCHATINTYYRKKDRHVLYFYHFQQIKQFCTIFWSQAHIHHSSTINTAPKNCGEI